MAKKEVQRAFVYSFEESAQDAAQQLPGQRRGVLQQDQAARPDHRRRDGAGRAADALDRGADRRHRERQEGVPRGDPDPHLVAGPARPAVRLHLPRAAEGGDREEAVRRPERRGEDHHLDQDARRRAAAPDQRCRRPPDRGARLLPGLRQRAAASTSARCSTARRVQRSARLAPTRWQRSQSHCGSDGVPHAPGNRQEQSRCRNVRSRSTTGRCTARGRSTRSGTTRRSRRRSRRTSREIVSEESIITLRRQEDRQGADPLAGRVPLPLRSAAGSSTPARATATARSATWSARSRGQGKGQARAQAGEEPGIDYYEAEITVDELAALIFEDLGLPFLEEKKQARDGVRGGALHRHPQDGPAGQPRQEAHDPGEPEAQRRQGRRQLRRHQERRPALQDLGADDPVRVERRRHRHDGRLGLDGRVREVHRAQLLLLDGALPAHEVQQRARSSSSPTTPRPRKSTRRSSSTTARAAARRCRRPTSWRWRSSKSAINPDDWNIYPFHFSDGDNWPWDNERCVDLVQQLLELLQHLRLRRDPRGRTTARPAR